MVKKTISRLLKLFNLSIIKTEKLTKIDIERKHYRHENDMFKFIFDNQRIKSPQKLYSYLKFSESQIFQDLFVLNELNYKEKGYFIEIGAADGKYLSNTYLLEKYFDWDGLVVEPAKVWEEKVKKNRDCQISTDCVHSKSNINIEFNETEKPEFSRSNISGQIEEDSHEYLRKKNNNVYQLTSISINDLFEKYEISENIDYLSIDTEGTEFLILNSLNLNKYNISIISVEHNHTKNREKIYNLLTKNGYTRVLEEHSKVDDWYIK
jgi:FkbM family methyltransferase